MFRMKLLLTISLFAFWAVHSVTAQEVKLATTVSAPVITGTASAGRVRFTAPSTVVQMHLKIYSDSGQAVFDVSSKGNVLDWMLQDSAGEHLSNGSYLCVVTVKSLSGRLSQRISSVSVAEKQIELQRVDETRFTPAQQQAVGPVEESAALTILKAGEPQATTIVANDGQDGQIVRDHGALSFHIGDFFSGKDTEQMRLTEEGNLGIGTDSPQAKLDVAGVIRTSKGIEFENGTNVTKLTTTATGSLQQTLADGTVVPNAAGTGTQNKLAKWADSSGTLGDSVVTEASGNIGIGTSSPQAALHVIGNQFLKPVGATPTYEVLAGSDPTTTVMLTTDSAGFGWQIAPSIAPSDTIAQVLGQSFPSVPNRGEFGIYLGADSNSAFKVIQRGGPELLRVNRNGNVGVGTTGPTEKLEVAGNVKVSGASNGLIFPDGTRMTTAASGGTMSGTSIVNAVNDPATVGTVSDTRLSANVARLNGANTFGSSQSVNGNVTATGSIAAGGGLTGGSLTVDANTLVVDRVNRRVGIGTIAPGEKLSVAGTVQSTSGGFKFPDGSVQASAAGRAYTTFKFGADVELSPAGPFRDPILHLDLPAGAYLIYATVQFENTANLPFQNNTRFVECQLVNEALWFFRIEGAGGAMDQMPVTMHTFTTTDGRGGIDLYCGALDGGIDRSYVFAKTRRFTAIKLGDVVTQP